MITMRDIAVRAGVSRSTVSFVLNDKHSSVGINEETRGRVLKAAADLGYRPNQLARAVVTGKNPVFAFLVPAPDVEVAGRLLGGAMEAADEAGHTVQIVRLPVDGDDAGAIRRCVELRPVGVMAIYIYEPALGRLQAEMARWDIPVAVLDSSHPQKRGWRILSDDDEGCRQAIGHLAALGHTDIGYIGGGIETGAGGQRERGYRGAMAAFGLPVVEAWVRDGYWAPEVIEEAARAVFADPSASPTALFCADDRTAMVACRVVRSLGLRVPGDISVVGYAGLTMAEFGDPPLTTVAQPFHRMGRLAVARLLADAAAVAEGADAALAAATPREEWLPTRLIVRASTAALPTRGT